MRITCLLVLLLTVPFGNGRASDNADAIERVLVESYVQGIHINRDAAAVEKGFHPGFIMHVRADGELVQAPLALWLERLQLDGKRNENEIEYRLDQVDVTDNTATAKLRIFRNSKLLYTDYFGLYRFDDGWKIVNKIFQGHN